jgi:hypothetical protein
LEPLPVSFTEKPKMKIVFYVYGCVKYINVLYAKAIFLCILLSFCVYFCIGVSDSNIGARIEKLKPVGFQN